MPRVASLLIGVAAVGATGVVVGSSSQAGASASPVVPLATGLNLPAAVAPHAGDLFFASEDGNAVSVLASSTGTVFGQEIVADTLTPLTSLSGLSGVASPTALAFDSAGDLFIGDPTANAVWVLPAASGTIYGQGVSADVPVALEAVTGEYANALAVEDGNLFIGGINSVAVLPATSGTVFGQAVTADTLTTLSATAGVDQASALAFDGSGDLYLTNFGTGEVFVLPDASGTVFGQSVTADVMEPLAAIRYALSSPTGLAFDATGNLYVADADTNAVFVLPEASGAVFGQTVTADTAVALSGASGLDTPNSIAFDGSGNLWVTNLTNSALSVLPVSTGTLFGQAVTVARGTTTPISAFVDPTSLVSDAGGDLYVADIGLDAVTVIPSSSGALFGQPVTAGVATVLQAASHLDTPVALATDRSGDLFVANLGNETISVLPVSSGRIFGQTVSADTMTVLLSGVDNLSALGFDAAGDLFVVTSGNTPGVSVLPVSSGMLFGQPVTADTLTTLSAASGLSIPDSLAIDAAGDLYISNWTTGLVSVLARSTGTLFGQSVTANSIATLNPATGLGPDLSALTFDPHGNLWLTNPQLARPCVVPLETGTIFGASVTADALSCEDAPEGFEQPNLIAFDGAGNLLVMTRSPALYAVVSSPPAVLTTSLPPAETSVSYSAALTGSGGVPPYTWSIVSGALPDGLLLSSSGVISGIPTTGGTSDFTVELTDRGGESITEPESIATAQGPTTTITMTTTTTTTTTTQPAGTTTTTTQPAGTTTTTTQPASATITATQPESSATTTTSQPAGPTTTIAVPSTTLGRGSPVARGGSPSVINPASLRSDDGYVTVTFSDRGASGRRARVVLYRDGRWKKTWKTHLSAAGELTWRSPHLRTGRWTVDLVVEGRTVHQTLVRVVAAGPPAHR